MYPGIAFNLSQFQLSGMTARLAKITLVTPSGNIHYGEHL